ncbi:MAG: RHS repeat-associated core domain-containing protein [Nanoarchaeota archaeon]|mgnify:FL=1
MKPTKEVMLGIVLLFTFLVITFAKISQAIQYSAYNPYGEVTQEGRSRYLFTGKELDRETNFEYYGARYYNPFGIGFIMPAPPCP